jgi:3D (Asp-Asp-Asp) domain-containing protein
MLKHLRVWFFRLLPVLLILAFCQGRAFARTPTVPRASERSLGRFVATAYSVSGETASQTITEEGRTLAADPNVLPIGTVVEVRHAGPYSGQYVVQDTGEKIVGRKVDIYIARTSEALQFGRRRVSIRILKPAPLKPSERRKAAAEAAIVPKPPKSERVSDYYQYAPNESASSETASVE